MAPSRAEEAPSSRPTREETRQRLLDSAYEVFCEVGFQGATVGAICTRAGFTRGAFYSNFRTLDELLVVVWERRLDATAAIVDHHVAQVARRGQPLERAMAALSELRAPDRHWFVISTELLLHALRSPELRERVLRRRERFRDDLRRSVGVLLAAAGRQPPEGVDLETFTHLLVAGHLGCQHVSATGTGPDDLHLHRAMVRALVAGCPPVDADVDLTG